MSDPLDEPDTRLQDSYDSGFEAGWFEHARVRSADYGAIHERLRQAQNLIVCILATTGPVEISSVTIAFYDGFDAERGVLIREQPAHDSVRVELREGPVKRR